MSASYLQPPYPTELDLGAFPALVAGVKAGDGKTATKAALHVVNFLAGKVEGEPKSPLIAASAGETACYLTWAEVQASAPLTESEVADLAAPGVKGVLDVITIGRLIATALAYAPQIASLIESILSAANPPAPAPTPTPKP